MVVVDTTRNPRSASTVAPGRTPPDESVTVPATAAGSWAPRGAAAIEHSRMPSRAVYRVVMMSFLWFDDRGAGVRKPGDAELLTQKTRHGVECSERFFAAF